LNEILNIEINNDILIFNYNPEQTENIGKVKYDLKGNKVIEIIPSTSDETEYYAYKALWYILDLIKDNKKIKEKEYQMWI